MFSAGGARFFFWWKWQYFFFSCNIVLPVKCVTARIKVLSISDAFSEVQCPVDILTCLWMASRKFQVAFLRFIDFSGYVSICVVMSHFPLSGNYHSFCSRRASRLSVWVALAISLFLRAWVLCSSFFFQT